MGSNVPLKTFLKSMPAKRSNYWRNAPRGRFSSGQVKADMLMINRNYACLGFIKRVGTEYVYGFKVYGLFSGLTAHYFRVYLWSNFGVY